MSREPCVVSLDLGTSSIKSLAATLEGNVIIQSMHPISTHRCTDGTAEQDPQEVYECVVRVLGAVVEFCYEHGYVIRCIGLSAAMHSLMFVQNGTPIGAAMTWMDSRAAQLGHRFARTSEGRALYQATGTPIHAMSPLVKLMWMREHHPEVVNQGTRVLSLKEWIWYKLFGVFEIDESMANATGLYDLTSRTWNTSALQFAGLTPAQLSHIVPTTRCLNDLQDSAATSFAHLEAQTPFCIGASDGALANLGIGVLTEADLVLTMGTSLAIRTTTNVPTMNPVSMSFCYILKEGLYITGGPSNSGGITLDWLLRTLGSRVTEGVSNTTFDTLLVKAGHIEKCDGLFCLPYIDGERAPLWRADAKAAWIGLDVSHKMEHIVRATVEGILYNAYWIAEKLYEGKSLPRTLVISGKLFNFAWIGQLVSDIFNAHVLVDTRADAASRGACLLAGYAVGIWDWSDIEKQSAASRTNISQTQQFQPRTEFSEYHHGRFQRFKQLAATLTPPAEENLQNQFPIC